MNINIKIIALILIISLPTKAKAQDYFKYTVGFSQYHADLNDPRYKVTFGPSLKEKIFNSFNVGVLTGKDNLLVGIYTNRLSNSGVTKDVLDLKTNLNMEVKEVITNDSLAVGYKLESFIPSIVVSNFKLEKTLFYNKQVVGYKANYVVLFSGSVGYLLTRDIIVNTYYTLPNKEIYLQRAIGIGINYVF